MQNISIYLLVQNLGSAGKLAVLAGMPIIVGLLYWILPKLMDSRLRSNYDQCDLEEEEEQQELLEEDSKDEI